MPEIESEYDDLDKYKNSYGDIAYYKKDTYIKHNPYGPAIVLKSGRIEYYIEDKLHRLSGPARIYTGGEKEYWINNKFLTEEEFEYHPDRLEFIGKGHLSSLL